SALAFRPMLLFFYHDTSTTELYTLSLHDALPIYAFGEIVPASELHRHVELQHEHFFERQVSAAAILLDKHLGGGRRTALQRHLRSEEHTSELQSRENLVCRLLLEKKNNL